MAIAPETFATDAGPDAPMPQKSDANAAVLVVHGIGEQDQHATLAQVVQGLRESADRPQGVSLQTVRIRGVSMPCARLHGTKDTPPIDVFEAYWAPLAVGKATLRSSMRFLLHAGLQGLRHALRDTHKRWLFNKPVTVERRNVLLAATFLATMLATVSLVVMNGTMAAIVGALAADRSAALTTAWPGRRLLEGLTAALLLFVGGLVLLGLWIKGTAWQVQKARAGDREALRTAGIMSRGGMVAFFVAVGATIASGIWFAILLLGGRPATQVSDVVSQPVSGSIYAIAGLWLLLGIATYKVRSIIVAYVGDILVYVGMPGPGRTDGRDAIRAHVVDIARRIYEARSPDGKRFRYGRIAIAGHSLGSVIAYDTLNELVLEDLAVGERLQILDRTRQLLTFGSPLDKVAFIFGYRKDDVQELLESSATPLIVDYAHRRFNWTNVWSPADIVSARLDLYDDPDMPADHPRRVQNIMDPLALTPLAAHNEYWKNPLVWRVLRSQLAGDTTLRPDVVATPGAGMTAD